MKGMDSVDGHNDTTMLWGNLATAVAYFVITSQLLLFVFNPKVVKVFNPADDAKDNKRRRIFALLLATAVLFASFISLCGAGHLMNVLVAINPNKDAVKRGQVVVMWLTALVSFATAIAGFPLFPTIANAIKGLELNSEGKLQLAESYLIEVVDLIKESILVLSEDLVVLKCNDVSKLLFGGEVVGSDICQYIHPDDLSLFTDAIGQASESYKFGATTVEVRIEHESSTASPKFNPQKQEKQSKHRQKGKNYKVYTTEEPHFEVDGEGNIEMGEATPLNADREAQSAPESYIWIEVTVCKGKQTMVNGVLEHDIKLVCRNIDDRKKRQAFQALVESTEERGRINESKLRYVSCIAHDLKTPLQSFTFSLDLLNQSDLQPEQHELIEHATIAIDLMKLTISQTMDISKALTGAKLMPRRTTVYLSSVLNRVKIIINGYGKQVPVSFEVAPDVCDEIITDEEWLWQMLLNLLTNACKYTDRGSIHVRISVTADKAMFGSANAIEKLAGVTPLKIPNKSCDMLLCEVIDTGVGISPDKMIHIFDAFAQVQEGQVTGTGLGLFGVRTRAEGLQGTCGARHNTESSTGTGTVLWFSVPYVPDVTAVTSESTKSPMNRPQASPTPTDDFVVSPHVNTVQLSRITASADLAISTEDAIRRLRLTAMVVEDTLTVRKLMQQLLIKMGFERVDCYENGSKGLDAMMAAPVDIVFSDVQMPIMTGPEMVARFRKWEADTLRAAVQSTRSSACASASADHNSGINEKHSVSGSVPPSPHGGPTTGTSLFSAAGTGYNKHGVTVLTLPSPLNRGGTQPSLPVLSHGHTLSNLSIPAAYPSNPQTARYMRTVRPRQLIVAVTANGAECGECGENGFDEICLKPLAKSEICRIINRYFS